MSRRAAIARRRSSSSNGEGAGVAVLGMRYAEGGSGASSGSLDCAVDGGGVLRTASTSGSGSIVRCGVRGVLVGDGERSSKEGVGGRKSLVCSPGGGGVRGDRLGSNHQRDSSVA